MKEQRHQVILEIIREKPVATQEELAKNLAQRGMEVTQATVSRDIRELRLIKVAAGAGYRYAEPPQLRPVDAYGRVRRALAEYITSIDQSGSMVVLKASAGTANAVAAALDDANLPEVLATLAGDDVVLIIVRETEPRPHNNPDVDKLADKLRALWGQETVSGQA